MKHLDRIYETADQHRTPSIVYAPIGLSYIGYDNGEFVHREVIQAEIRGADGSYSRSFVKAIHSEIVK